MYIEDVGFSNHVSLPSQRTALSICLWLSAMHYNCVLAFFLSLLIPGVILGTVYAGLNYTLDVVIGVFVGSMTYSLGGHIILWMHQRTIRSRDLWFGGGCCSLSEYTSVSMNNHHTDRHHYIYAKEDTPLAQGDMFI